MASLTAYNRTTLDCVRCGICKSRCPTYEEALSESMGARGRVALINHIQSSGPGCSQEASERIFTCLLCGACNALCPLGIDVTGANYEIRSQARLSQKKTRLVGFLVNQLVKRPELFFGVLRGLNIIAKYLPYKGSEYIRQIDNMRLEIPHSPFSKTMGISKAIRPIGRIALFAGCTVNYILPGLAFALTEVLNAIGYDVVVPRNSLCCGAPLLSMGFPEDAVRLAERQLEVFSGLSIEGIVTLCPTCVYTMTEGYKRLIGRGVKDITDATGFLYQNWERLRPLCEGLNFSYVGSLIKYHHPCHTINYLHHKKEGPFIMRGLGLEFSEGDKCCGFGGPFRFLYGGLSMDIVSKRQQEYGSTEMVVTSCPNCILQFRAAKINSRHFIELIKVAMRR